MLAAGGHAAWTDRQTEPCHTAMLVPLTSAQIAKARVLAPWGGLILRLVGDPMSLLGDVA